jgi:predicted site-specific integrase-resolvase
MNNGHSVYEQLGFKLVGKTSIGYSYIMNRHRLNRFKFRKSELIKEGFDSNKTEVEIMNSRGYYRIFDSGNLKFVYEVV